MGRAMMLSFPWFKKKKNNYGRMGKYLTQIQSRQIIIMPTLGLLVT
jgi:hypothetical protein